MKRLFKALLIVFTLIIMVSAAVFVYAYLYKPFIVAEDNAHKPKTNESDKKNNGAAEKQKEPENQEKNHLVVSENTPSPADNSRPPDTKNTPSNHVGIEHKNTEDYFLTAKETMEIENISVSDKLIGLAIISKLKEVDIDKVIAMAQDGITYKEVDELEKLLEKKLSRQDIDKLMVILLKNKKLYAEGKSDK